MKVFAFSASNHSQSINRTLVAYATKRLKEYDQTAEIEFADLNDYEMPIYSIDREEDGGVHPLAQSFYDRIGAADALIVSFAEYNGSVTSAWKNIFDWMSRIDRNVWQNKPMVILAATPGPRAGASVLQAQEVTAEVFGMNLKGKHGVGNWADAWDGKALTIDEDTAGVDAAVRGLLV